MTEHSIDIVHVRGDFALVVDMVLLVMVQYPIRAAVPVGAFIMLV